MGSFSYIFRGEAASKKNSRRIVTVRGRPVPIPSKKYVAWEKYARQVILSSGRPGTPFPAATLTIRIYHGDMVRRDTNNSTQGIQDVLVDMGVIADDNWMVIGSPRVDHFIDVSDPRMEVDVTGTEPVDYRTLFKEARKLTRKNQ